jgi:hypothetical protein
MAPAAMGTCAVVSFTSHAYVLTDLAPADLEGLELDGYGAASEANALVRLAAGRQIGSLDVVLVTTGRGGGVSRGGAAGVSDQGPWALDRSHHVGLADRQDLEHHPRVERARHHRRDVRVLGDERGFVTIGSGLVGRTELSVELLDTEHNRGAGRDLIKRGLEAIHADMLVFAQVAPGNAASLRAFLAAGFVPIGSEVLIEPRQV